MAGLTRLKDLEWDLVSKLYYCQSHADKLFIQCLYESQNTQCLEKKFGRNIVTFENGPNISNYDAFALGYCISTSSNPWDITVSSSPGFRLEMLGYGLKCGASGGSINRFRFSSCEEIINDKIEIPNPSLKHIESLSFSHCSINERGFRNLAECLPSLHSLTSLELREYPMPLAGVAVLLQALRDHGKLESLTLGGMHISVDAANALVRLPLRKLNISTLHEPPEVSSRSPEAVTLYDLSLTILDGVDDIGVNIYTLGLNLCPVARGADPREVKYGTKLSRILRKNTCTSLKELQVEIPIDKDVVCDILHSLEDNRTLEKLVVESRLKQSVEPVMTESASEQLPANLSLVRSGTMLSNSFRSNKSLKELQLIMPLDQNEVHYILQSLEENNTLEKLELTDNDYTMWTPTQLASQAPNSSRVKGGTKLGNFIRRNTSVKNFKLFFPLDIDELHDMVHSLEDNHTLEELVLPKEYQAVYFFMAKEEPRISWIPIFHFAKQLRLIKGSPQLTL